MNTKFMIFLIVGLFVTVINQITIGQISPIKGDIFPVNTKNTFNAYKKYKPNRLKNISPAHYTKSDWKEIIDSTWGAGLSTEENLNLFDNAWQLLDEGYGAFMNININLDSLRDLYRPEIEAGVSLGRFTAIMNHLAYALKNAHTFINYKPININTEIQDGIPLFVIGACVNISYFGAGLTPLPDSSLLVYKSLQNHTLNLQPGDIVLGYDGIPWKKIYKNLLESELPLRNILVGGNDESTSHILLQSAGLNWHLFDTIDIIKYYSRDTIHLPTVLLKNQSGDIWGNEQMPISGVNFPDLNNSEFVTWGIVDGTTIGYIYVWYWYWDLRISNQFYDAVYELMNNYETTGLILDLRVNYGGAMEMAHEGYTLLFNEIIENVAFDVRGDPSNHVDMILSSLQTSNRFTINGDPNTFYDKPIAVLTGPNSYGCGEWESVRMQFHPMVRTFGKTTNGAFTIWDIPILGNPDFMFHRAKGSGYLIENHEYLVHRSANIDMEVWLTQEDVVKGDDTVVKKAIEWINSTNGINEKTEILNNNYFIANYPNPFNHQTKIKYTIPEPGKISLKVYNMFGKEVANIISNEYYTQGKYIKNFDNQNYNLSPGVYFISLTGNNIQKTQKMIID